MSEPVVHIIDDDEAVGRALAALTRTTGRRVATYTSARTFLESVDPSAAGCVVTDVRMPGLNGLDLLRMLGQRGAVPPVIMMSGQGDIPMAVEAIKLGAVDFLEKPFDSSAFLDAVTAALEQGVERAARQAGLASIRENADHLTLREREVMGLVVAGYSNQAVAVHLGISTRTVENHRAKVMDKMGAAGLSDLIRMAMALAPKAAQSS